MISGSAIVFGATGGIGQEIVSRLLTRGTLEVVGTYRSENEPNEPRIRWVPFDAADPHPEIFAAGLNEIKHPLRALFYCIGVPSAKRPIADTPQDEWIALFRTNCVGFVSAYTAVRTLCRASGSRIVAVSSDATRTVRETNGAYTASKAALEAVISTLAKEEAPYGVRVNALAPSLVDSPLSRLILDRKGVSDISAYAQTQPWGRLLTLREVAEAAVGIAVDDSWAYSTGQVIRLAAAL